MAIANHWQVAMAENFAKLRGDGLEDFTIICGNQKFEVHSMMLCVHSPVLAKMCHGQFKETQQRTINLSSHEIPVIEALLDFLYTAAYSYSDAYEALEFDCTMYVLADEYNMDHLLKTANDRIQAAVTTARTEDLVGAAAVVWEASGATEAIRPLFADAIVRTKAWESNAPLFLSVSEINVFAFDLVEAYKRQAERVEYEEEGQKGYRRYQCDSCGSQTLIARKGAIDFANPEEFLCPNQQCWAGRQKPTKVRGS